MSSKPNVQAVVDLGLRDVGVENDPRQPYREFMKALPKVLVLVVLSLMAVCLLVGLAGVGPWIVFPLVLAWTGGLLFMAQRAAKRARPQSVKITAEGTNQAAPLMISSALVLVVAGAMTLSPVMVPVVLLMLVVAVFAWRGRGRVPEVLRELRSLLGADETVLGDGIGLAKGERRWNEAFRLLVATDRRLLVTPSTRSSRPFPLIDVPYEWVSGFDVEWKQLGRAGTLSLTVAAGDDGDPETHVINMIAPANLLSIARVLQSHGVHPDDPAPLAAAEQAWAEAHGESAPAEPQDAPAQPPSAPPSPPRPSSGPLFDSAQMNTPQFDRGLWVLLGLAAVVLYLNPFGIGLGMRREAGVALLVFVPIVCAVSGYLSGTKSSVAYLLPLNLLVSPAFFFADASVVIALMLMVSAVAALGLWAGSALGRRAAAPAQPADPASRPTPGSLRHAISAQRLIRITGVMVGVVTGLAVVSSAAGFPLSNLRLAIDELTVKQVPVDGRSNLTGNYASLRYTTGPDLREFITDGPVEAKPDGGQRWELRSRFTKGYNMVSLAHYVFEPALDDPKAIADFVAEKDREHSRLAGHDVTHTERMVDGRKGYVWNHGSWTGRWYYAAWFPQPVHTIRVECIATKQKDRFKRLCAEAVGSLRFHDAAQ